MIKKIRLKKDAPGMARMFTGRKGGTLVVRKDKPIDVPADVADALLEDYGDMIEDVKPSKKEEE